MFRQEEAQQEPALGVLPLQDCTVCDRAAEACPTFPGAPALIHWSLPDPAGASGSEEEKLQTFESSATDLMQRIRLWLSLPRVAERIPAAAPSRG